MCQRVAVARAFALRAGLRLADESFSALEAVTACELRELFVDLTHKSGGTTTLIAHQLEKAIEEGEGIFIFGKSARFWGDVRVNSRHSTDRGALYDGLRKTIESGGLFSDVVNSDNSSVNL